MFTPTLRCECTQPGLIDTMRKWSISSLPSSPSIIMEDVCAKGTLFEHELILATRLAILKISVFILTML